MKMKKLCAILLTAGMVLSAVGCGSTKTDSTADTKSDGNATAKTEGVTDGNYGGLVAMEDANDPITYTVFVRDPGVVPAESNPVIKKIQELTGVTLKFEFLVGDLDQL